MAHYLPSLAEINSTLINWSGGNCKRMFKNIAREKVFWVRSSIQEPIRMLKSWWQQHKLAQPAGRGGWEANQDHSEPTDREILKMSKNSSNNPILRRMQAFAPCYRRIYESDLSILQCLRLHGVRPSLPAWAAAQCTCAGCPRGRQHDWHMGEIFL